MSSANLDTDLLLAAVAALPDDALAVSRRAAARRFAETGFPHVGQEDWKYTSLDNAIQISNEWLNSMADNDRLVVQEPGSDALEAARPDLDAHWLELRNGVSVSDLERLSDETGLLFEHVTASDLDGETADQPMSLFNLALLRDGLRISMPSHHDLDKPLVVLCLDNPSNAVTQTRLLIDAGAESRLQIVELNLSDQPGRQFSNSVVQLTLAAGAAVDYLRIQNRDTRHTGVCRFEASLERDARLSHNNFDLGGALSRNDTVADIRGPGAAVSLHGLYLGSGEQHIDNHTAIVHGVGPATSTEEYRGILTGKARCIFNGKVVVTEGADGTDSSQTNHNLLLSDRAEIDTKPELEIYADDVKCAHGATVGQLDETAVFYLRSRGLARDEARQLLTRAFAAGSLSQLAVEAAHDYLAGILEDRLRSLVGDRP
jgi:Fe-S cluster assembly protein SufD